jgi:predicted RNA binding protein YcfA (HicA-like mRNA interferase family)
MAKLPAVKPRQVIRFLQQGGFLLDHASGSHFIFFHPPLDAARWSLVIIATCQKEL